MGNAISGKYVQQVFAERISELLEEPEYNTMSNETIYAMDAAGMPLVKVAVGNVPLDYDLWEGMRNPASIGAYPAGLPEFWEFYANRKKRNIDETGRQSIFQIPRTYDSARDEYKRAVIISVMMPFSKSVVDTYAHSSFEKGGTKIYEFKKTYDKVNQIIDKAVQRTAIDFMNPDNIVIPLNKSTVQSISEETLPVTRQGSSHGPCIEVNIPQKSIAVLFGLGQIGVSRMVFRDEIIDGKAERFAGPVRSVVIFDKNEIVKNGKDGILYPTPAWREFLFRLTDYTDIDPAMNQYRYCSYIPDGNESCAQCVRACPTGAQSFSTPNTTGEFPEKIAKQTYRFYDGKLRFDFSRCLEDRGQMSTIFPEWSCTRCLTACMASGVRKEFSAENYPKKIQELTT